MPVGERRLLEAAELWPQEQRLCAKAAEGGLLDLRCRQPGEDGPNPGPEVGPPAAHPGASMLDGVPH